MQLVGSQTSNRMPEQYKEQILLPFIIKRAQTKSEEFSGNKINLLNLKEQI